jgi:nucleoside-diphosphate-sugar epimerase
MDVDTGGSGPLLEEYDQLEVIQGDVSNPEDCRAFCEGADGAVLFHTAGIIHPTFVSEYYQVNVEGTENILEAAVQAGVERVVAVSSNSPCGNNPHSDHRFTEESPYNPYMHYGRSKMEMEKAVRKCGETEDIETVIVRAPWFYGPNGPPRQARFFRMIRDGFAPLVGDGTNCRSMVYLENLCDGLVRAAAATGADGDTFWVADERPYTMNEIYETVERILSEEFGQSCAGGRLRVPGWVGDLATHVDGAIQSLGLYNKKIHVLSEMNKNIACSVGKAKSELGYDPDYDLSSGMERTIEDEIDQSRL